MAMAECNSFLRSPKLNLQPDTVLVSFPDIPEALTEGGTKADVEAKLHRAGLKPHQFRCQVAQIDDADGVQAGHVAGAFAGVEDGLPAVLLQAVKVGVAVQG